jgi:hypothetical protein
MMHKIMVVSTVLAMLVGAAVANAQARYGNSDTVLPSFEDWPHYASGLQSARVHRLAGEGLSRSQCAGRSTKLRRGRRK